MLHINDLTYRIDGRTLFDAATAAIADGWKVGFVGRNGAGKSTLIRIIRDELHADGGAVSVRPGRRIGHVAQEAPASSESLLEVVLKADEERAALLAEADTATDPERIAEIQTRLADIEAHSAEARAAEILSGLGFSHADQSRACAEFSGGWRMRVALAGVLFAAPDLLLLDEPTNYLDLEGAVWLEAYLKRYPYTALIVSHDRGLLNRAVTHILALEHGKLSIEPGTYDDFARRRAERAALLVQRRQKQEAEKKRLQAFVDRFKAKASKARQAQSRVKMLEKMNEIAVPLEERATPFVFPAPRPAMAPPIVRLVEVDLGYGDAPPVLKNVTLRVDPDDRIAILGPNGQGKSTLVKAISGRLAPQNGQVLNHKKLKVAYFSQHQVDELRLNETPYDHVRTLMPDGTEAQVRARTAQLGFGPQKADVKVGKLSGGERARLLLGLATFDGAHLLILDEPTNHLDIESREALVRAIAEYEGAVLLITHDAYLAEACADRLWLVNGGAVAPYSGDLSDYRALILEASRSSSSGKPAAASTRATPRKVAAEKREALAPLKQKIDDAETRMEALKRDLKKADELLAEPGLFETNVDRGVKLSKLRSDLEDALSAAEERWLEASEAYDAARAAQ